MGVLSFNLKFDTCDGSKKESFFRFLAFLEKIRENFWKNPEKIRKNQVKIRKKSGKKSVKNPEKIRGKKRKKFGGPPELEYAMGVFF